jgi:hypothetical protein
MKRFLPVLVLVLTVVVIAAGSLHTKLKPTTPDGTVQMMFASVKARDWDAAFAYVANASSLQKTEFVGELAGRDGSLRAYSALDRVDTGVLYQNQQQALVRVNLRYSSAVGALEDSRDLKVLQEGGEWKVVWPVSKETKAPPQVIAVTFLRWDVIYRGSEDDWGAQDVAPPKVRVTSMNAVEHNRQTAILGEIVNDDTVPGFVSVDATLIGRNGDVLGEETAFDKISHTLLPKEVSPFRIDFPGVRLAQIKSVRMSPNALLVPASADPVVGVLHQHLDNDPQGQRVLAGELVNQGGQVVNIAQLLATFYDNSGKVIWVSDGYVSHALLPEIPQPFTIGVAPEIASRVQSYRVIVNKFSWNRQQ